MAEVLNLPLQHVKKKHLSIATFSLLLVTLATPTLSGNNYRRCSVDQFSCKDGSCILLEKMCDGRPDCHDGTDELDCEKLCLQPKWFQCAQPHGPCLSSDLVCNGVANCPGGEDERDCVGRLRGSSSSSSKSGGDVGTGGWLSSLPRNCSAFEYTCQTDKMCIPLDFMCDGKSDCKDSSDEVAGCLKAEANCRGFFCSNKKCLESQKWVCDGINDCGDGSDERNCVSNCTPELGKFLCRDNITCLNVTQACNNKSDCPDGSDEAARCNVDTVNCSQKKCPPAAECHMLPVAGPICLCPKGYSLGVLQNNCEDINECLKEYGICSQGCENTAGSYKCTCDAGYTLRADNKTCEITVAGQEALLLYSTQVTVMGVHLGSHRVFTVAKNLTKVIGISYDGANIYWTNIQNEAESIVRAKADGTEQEILLTSGLDAPEDLAVDWLTGNIYFSDNVMHHIAVCSNDGVHCAVLVTIDVHQPRGIALWPQRAQIFWSDWGTRPMIVRASMDGSNSLPIVSDNIHWPNGIALDMHNNRLYWVDAKLSTMESVRTDGSDRRIIIDEILKHPYGIAVFEDNIYWSDWGTKSVHSCNKFTGKDHKIVAKDRTIYAVHIYHAAKQPKTAHACENTRCSHLCLLAENNSSTCACPDGMQLSTDHLRCIKSHKRQRLFVGIKNTLLEIEHTTFGRHVISESHQLPMYIGQMTYNSINGTIIVADNMQHAIFEYDRKTKKYVTLTRGNMGNVTDIAFDHLAHNVYWTDAERHSVEVFSLRTHTRAIVSFFSGIEVPTGISIVPEDGLMFVALKSRNHVHIDQYSLTGQGEHKHVFEDELGDDDINFATDYDFKTLYWADSDLGRISFSDYRKPHAYTFRGRLRRPYSLAIVGDDLFWSELKSSTIHWTHKSNMGPVKRIDIEITKDAFNHVLPARIPLLASVAPIIADHPCQQSNGGCSHVCVSSGKFIGICLCPAGFVFRDAVNRTCIEALDCEFRCRTGECLTASHRCNGRKDCPDDSDEEGCEPSNQKRAKVTCSLGQFMCHDAQQCVANEKRCDSVKDCHDGSDEQQCEHFDKTKQCHRHQHACDNGNCVDFSSMCDGINDCGDNSDESNCKLAQGKEGSTRPVCDKSMFQCNSGTCIAKSWECDGKLDCTDGSDEHDKCDLKECGTNMHKCLLGQCIDLKLVCDSHNDCGDYSDEINCDLVNGKKRNVTCGNEDQQMYQCPSNVSICLDLTAKCNGTAECPRGEDEADCGAMCSIYEFQCKTSKICIRAEFRCDHEKDCADGSDELNCANATMAGSVAVTHERVCEPDMFDCKDGGCVDMSRVCDGFPDCDSGTDEGPMCKTACKSTTGIRLCTHKCRATPMGAECSCFDGFKLDDADKRSCVDINECELLDPCAQLCENTLGSYRCGCYPDFMLRTDKTSCKSIESQSALMFSTYNEVRSMTELPIVLRVAWSTNDSKINGFDVNVRKRLGYFSTDSENVLYQVDMNTGNMLAGLTVEMPTKVAVDWITDNVYVISRSHQYTVVVCSFTAKMCGRIAQANPRATIKSLAVDAFNRRLFYVSVAAQTFGLPHSQISILNLDGKKREMLLSANGAFITSIATDPHKKLLYFVDLHSQTLQAISYKLGGNRSPQIIVQKGNIVLHPSGLSVYENEAFIVNIGSKEAIKCNLYGTRTCKAFNLNIFNAEDIVIDGASRQPLATNPCVMAQCASMCIQSDYGYECMCGDVIVDEHTVCDKALSNEVSSSALFTLHPRTSEDDDDTHTMHVIIGLTLLLLVLLAVGIGYWYYRRVQEGHRDFNISLHFQNPLSSLAGDGKTAAMQSASTTDTTAAAYGVDHQRTQSKGSSFIRFLRGTAPKNGTDIHLEAANQAPHEVRTFSKGERMSNVLVEDDDSDNDTRTNGNYDDDDARARLVF